jgi:cytosine/adenosine deaminase-related metal-dependent hydrolase
MGYVLVMNGHTTVEAVVAESDAGDDIQQLDGILSPGFVNAHCHIELSHMKGGIPIHTGLVDFVQQVMTKREDSSTGQLSQKHATEFLEKKQQDMILAAAELYNSGTVAVGDICNTADSLELKKNSAINWHNFIEVSGFVDATAEKRLQAVEEIISAFSSQLPFSENSLSPHAPYSVSKTMFHLLNEKTAQQIISIHNQEAAAENELYQNKTGAFLELYKNLGINIEHFLPSGKTSMQSWLPYFSKGQKIISVHNTFTDNEDLSYFQLPASPVNLFFCICINANLYIENSLPPIDMLIKNNCNIVMGTDSYASNWNLNMMEEIKMIQKHFSHIPLETILQWATSNGAKALGIEDVYGSFEKGKKPGLVIIDNAVAKRID